MIKNILRKLVLTFELNIPLRNLFIKKEETVVTIIKTFLNVSLGEVYKCSKSIRKLLGLPSIQKIGVMNLENEESELDKGCFESEIGLASLSSERKIALKEVHESKWNYYELIKLKTKESVVNTPEQPTFIPDLEFEENSKQFEEVVLSKDYVDIDYTYHVPYDKSYRSKEIKLINCMGEDIHKSTLQKASVSQGQLKRGGIPILSKVKKGNEAKEPKFKNILVYASLVILIFIKISLLCGFISEGIILKNIAFYNLGYSEEESWVIATSLLGITFGISRLRFNSAERLIRTIKKQSTIIIFFAAFFFIQLTLSGVLSNYNIQHEDQLETLKDDRMDLAMKQNDLLDFEGDIEDKVLLEQEVSRLNKSVNGDTQLLKQRPFWVRAVGYFVVAFLSVLTLFFTIVLKALGEVYSYSYKLKKTIQRNEERIIEIEELYVTKSKELLTAYNYRHLFCYYIARKHVIEQLLAQKDDLKTAEFYEAYNIK